jgi:hypothetical protein
VVDEFHAERGGLLEADAACVQRVEMGLEVVSR